MEAYCKIKSNLGIPLLDESKEAGLLIGGKFVGQSRSRSNCEGISQKGIRC